MIARIRSGLGGAGALALLPLSALPLLLVGPSLMSSHARFDRKYHSEPYAAPMVSFSASAAARYAPARPFTGAVPVLAYHGINDDNDRYSIGRQAFALQLEMLELAGYESITIDQYLRFRGGDTAGLPPRPILITFDDGRLDSYRGADAILAAHGMSAVMFVITGPLKDGNPFYLSWRELHRMRASGRWDIQPHAHDGHVNVVTDPSGTTGPFYTSRRYTRTDGVETFAAYTQRAATDIYEVKDDFAQQGLPSETFAVPYGEHGQNARDPRVAAFFDDLLATQFRAVFIQAAGNDPRYTRPTGPAWRYEVHTSTRPDDLHDWLVRHNPAERRAAGAGEDGA